MRAGQNTPLGTVRRGGMCGADERMLYCKALSTPKQDDPATFSSTGAGRLWRGVECIFDF